ncbi:ABC transporter substrate-binding protein [Massilia aerilata]|uniref:ABC transporter substrate-binding protein n=1 Tax=Massilia aerilata TaxID=453817 RepID=A0ABW0RVW1_9BURK
MRIPFQKFAAGLSALALATATAFAAPARAEGQLRIAQQFGLVYLLLNVAEDQKLIEKHAKLQGVPVKVDVVQLSGGNAVNDALLSGAIDVAGAGVGPLLTIWDRTRGRQNVRGIASLGNFPYYLVSTNPKVRTIADFSDADRIALPAVTVSVQARILQMAAAKKWGTAQYTRLDRLTQSVPHPDATAAVIAGQTELNSHFGNPPFQDQELAGNPKAHIVLNSYDVLGGPSSSTVLYATEKWVKENPKTYRAFVDALNEAAQLIAADPELATDAYLRVTRAKTDRAFLLKVIRNPQIEFKVAPQNTLGLAQFLHQAGAIKTRAASWRDYFFEHPALAAGS